MSVTGPAHSAVDWVNPVNWGPWGPLAGALGWGPAGHVGRAPERGSGELQRGGDARVSSGFAHGGPFGARLGPTVS